MQSELSDQIDERMTEARQSILDNFDEEVSVRLKDCHTNTIMELDRFSQVAFQLFVMQGAERVEPLNQWRFTYKTNGEARPIICVGVMQRNSMMSFCAETVN